MQRVNRQEYVFLGRLGITAKIKWVLKLELEQGLGIQAGDEVNSRIQDSPHSWGCLPHTNTPQSAHRLQQHATTDSRESHPEDISLQGRLWLLVGSSSHPPKTSFWNHPHLRVYISLQPSSPHHTERKTRTWWGLRRKHKNDPAEQCDACIPQTLQK